MSTDPNAFYEGYSKVEKDPKSGKMVEVGPGDVVKAFKARFGRSPDEVKDGKSIWLVGPKTYEEVHGRRTKGGE